MNVWINGQSVEIDQVATVAELATRLGLATHTVLIEHNGTALHEREWPMRQLAQDDRVEFIRVVAGG